MHRFKTFPKTFSMDDESLDKLERLAGERGISLSACVRALIHEAGSGRQLVDTREPYVASINPRYDCNPNETD